ncbi:MAG: flagellar biosynthesis protein FlhB, partial [Phycisphaerales bacterium]|nr:flagellar biosynthesis protein FlhB [Phycisphaerales bacterium]
AESLGEKTEDVTPRKLEQARERGQVAKSQDLAGAVSLAVGTVLIVVYGGVVLERSAGLLRAVLEHEIAGGPLDSADPMATFIAAMMTATVMVAPVLAITFVASYLVYYLQVGWIFTFKPVTPDLNKLSPIKGVKRLFDTKNLVKTGVNILKLTAAIGLTWAVVVSRFERLAALPSLGVEGGMWLIGVTVLEVAVVLAILLLVIGLIDWLYQRWQFKRDQRMTKQEVKEERRSMEGDVETKRRRARMYTEIARQQVRAGTPTADVIVTNPTHYSVGIRYDGETMDAPTVVAKGADLLAFQIRQIATNHGIPLIERPPLARALYHGTEVGEQIAPEHYAAVAEVLAYVYRLDADARQREGVGAA